MTTYTREDRTKDKRDESMSTFSWFPSQLLRTFFAPSSANLNARCPTHTRLTNGTGISNEGIDQASTNVIINKSSATVDTISSEYSNDKDCETANVDNNQTTNDDFSVLINDNDVSNVAGLGANKATIMDASPNIINNNSSAATTINNISSKMSNEDLKIATVDDNQSTNDDFAVVINDNDVAVDFNNAAELVVDKAIIDDSEVFPFEFSDAEDDDDDDDDDQKDSTAHADIIAEGQTIDEIGKHTSLTRDSTNKETMVNDDNTPNSNLNIHEKGKTGEPWTDTEVQMLRQAVNDPRHSQVDAKGKAQIVWKGIWEFMEPYSDRTTTAIQTKGYTLVEKTQTDKKGDEVDKKWTPEEISNLLLLPEYKQQLEENKEQFTWARFQEDVPALKHRTEKALRRKQDRLRHVDDATRQRLIERTFKPSTKPQLGMQPLKLKAPPFNPSTALIPAKAQPPATFQRLTHKGKLLTGIASHSTTLMASGDDTLLSSSSVKSPPSAGSLDSPIHLDLASSLCSTMLPAAAAGQRSINDQVMLRSLVPFLPSVGPTCSSPLGRSRAAGSVLLSTPLQQNHPKPFGSKMPPNVGASQRSANNLFVQADGPEWSTPDGSFGLADLSTDSPLWQIPFEPFGLNAHASINHQILSPKRFTFAKTGTGLVFEHLQPFTSHGEMTKNTMLTQSLVMNYREMSNDTFAKQKGLVQTPDSDRKPAAVERIENQTTAHFSDEGSKPLSGCLDGSSPGLLGYEMDSTLPACQDGSSNGLNTLKHSPVAQTGEIDCEGVNKENRPPSVSSTHPVNKNSKLPPPGAATDRLKRKRMNVSRPNPKKQHKKGANTKVPRNSRQRAPQPSSISQTNIPSSLPHSPSTATMANLVDEQLVEPANPIPFTLNEFKELWELAEKHLGKTAEEAESESEIRAANKRFKGPSAQTKAQYGRLLAYGATLVFKLLNLTVADVFADWGSGIGNTLFQAAFTVGCETKGIEVVKARNDFAKEFYDELKRLREELSKGDGATHCVGDVQLCHGGLEEVQHHEYLTGDVSAVFMNNFDANFADKANPGKEPKTNELYVDNYAAANFADLKPGARMMTLHPLPLGCSKSETNKKRAMHDLPQSDYASFFEMTVHDLGPANELVSWGGKDDVITAYLYTRVAQPGCPKSVFLCSNYCCPEFWRGKPIPATVVEGQGKVAMNYCTCRCDGPQLRPRKSKM